MKVKRLKMNSFRGIGDLTLEFTADEPTILIGINGVGKSSILHSLALLLSCFIKGIQSYGFSPWVEISEQDITNGRNKTDNEITISLDSSQEVTWSLSKVRQGSSEDASSDLAELKGVTQELYKQWSSNPNVNLPLAVYYPVNREFLKSNLPLTNNRPQLRQTNAYNQAIPAGQIDFKSFFEWFCSLEDVENESRRDDPAHRDYQLEAVRQAISSLLGDNVSNLRVRRNPLRMTMTKQGQELNIYQLSDGETGLLVLAADLARRLAIANPGLADPLQGSGVVLIDEIELHLHPAWQRKVIPALKRMFPNCQFIITTHSPQVISEVKPEGIYILERTDAGIVAMRPESSYGRDTNRILEDLMDTPDRPQEIKENLLELFRLIARGELDSARQLHQKIADEIGADEPELVGASVSIRRREILGR
jgi:predicted ATP-binding protein involved in virulence